MADVKVMSDLSMMTAGETTLEFDRMSCFLSAVDGFSPLLFEMLEKKIDLNELLDACRQVWENAEKDDYLLDKWVRIKNHRWITLFDHFKHCYTSECLQED